MNYIQNSTSLNIPIMSRDCASRLSTICLHNLILQFFLFGIRKTLTSSFPTSAPAISSTFPTEQNRIAVLISCIFNCDLSLDEKLHIKEPNLRIQAARSHIYGTLVAIIAVEISRAYELKWMRAHWRVEIGD